MELECDVSAVRTVRKRHAAKLWFKSHGYDSFDQVLPTDFETLKGLLAQFGTINCGTDTAQLPLSEPVRQGSSSEAESFR